MKTKITYLLSVVCLALIIGLFIYWRNLPPKSAVKLNPNIAVKRLESVKGDMGDFRKAYKEVASEWVKTDPEAATEWAFTITDNDDDEPGDYSWLRDDALQTIAEYRATANPEQGLRLAFNIRATPPLEIAVKNIADTWAAKEPETFKAWNNAVKYAFTTGEVSDVTALTKENIYRAVAFTMLQETPWLYKTSFEAVAPVWFDLEPRHALIWSKHIKHLVEVKPILANITMAQVKKNPDTAEWYTQLDYRAAVHAWASVEPEKAALWAQKKSQTEDETELLRSNNYHAPMMIVAYVWAERDPKKAALWAATVEDDTMRNYLMTIILAQTDPDKATANINTFEREIFADKSYFAIAYATLAMGRTDPAKAYLIAKSGRSLSHINIRDEIASQWVAKDLEGAIQWVQSKGRSWDYTSIAKAWVAHDQSAAIAWPDSIAKEGVKDRVKIGLVVGLVAKDLKHALKLAETITDVDRRSHALEDIVKEMAHKDPYQSGQIALGIEYKHSRQDALNTVVRAGAYTDPEGAIEFAEKVEEKKSRLELFKIIVEIWGAKAPKQAIEFAFNKLEGLKRESALREIMESWRELDEPAATAWVETVDPMITSVAGPHKTMRENLLSLARSSNYGRRVISISVFPK